MAVCIPGHSTAHPESSSTITITTSSQSAPVSLAIQFQIFDTQITRIPGPTTPGADGLGRLCRRQRWIPYLLFSSHHHRTRHIHPYNNCYASTNSPLDLTTAAYASPLFGPRLEQGCSPAAHVGNEAIIPFCPTTPNRPVAHRDAPRLPHKSPNATKRPVTCLVISSTASKTGQGSDSRCDTYPWQLSVYRPLIGSTALFAMHKRGVRLDWSLEPVSQLVSPGVL
ncbi:hypothetical protein K456DRAFT_1126117 [Colletotrichum gloeosporioides 23]|nr:hypothetical protein K456DRAFT_1126117 [Colletotrichum gloeosporioides 23]